MVGRKLQLDMEKAGIHLPAAQRERMQELMNSSHHYAVAFNTALRDPRELGSVRVRRGLTGATTTLPLDPGTVSSLLSSEPSAAVRKQVWQAASRSPGSNVSLLEAMIGARSEMARLLGQPSFSHLKATGASLAERPEAIVAFLTQLANAVKPYADQECQELAGGPGKQLQPWDLDLALARARSRAAHQGLTVSRSLLENYTQLTSVLDGLAALTQQLLGIRLSWQPAAGGEAWAPGVIKVEAQHAEEGHLGTVFLDLVSRPGKYPSAVTFPIRCGRELEGGKYQAPIMVLSADFGPPGSSAAGVVLGARELRVLLHEWGHCLHNLASRTRYQHHWGTRCAQDMVELPSLLWEKFASDPRSLALLARHRTTRDPLPDGLAAAMCADRSHFWAIDLQQQVLLSLADQRLFGAPEVPAGGTSDAWRHAVEPHSSLPWITGSHPEARFGHLTIYAATYYAYVYARCLSSAVWNKLLAQDPLDPQAGEAVRRGLLRPGGGMEPVEQLQALLGPQALQQHPGSGGWAPPAETLLVSCMAQK
ncbi:hypothetical protein V8C86DRAFT_2574236 [Haematococcus lacustris]